MFYHTLMGAKFGGKAKFDKLYETIDSDMLCSNNLLTFPTHSFNIYELANTASESVNRATNLV